MVSEIISAIFYDLGNYLGNLSSWGPSVRPGEPGLHMHSLRHDKHGGYRCKNSAASKKSKKRYFCTEYWQNTIKTIQQQCFLFLESEFFPSSNRIYVAKGVF